MIDVSGSSPLWESALGGGWGRQGCVRRARAEQASGSKLVSSTPPRPLVQFLPLHSPPPLLPQWQMETCKPNKPFPSRVAFRHSHIKQTRSLEDGQNRRSVAVSSAISQGHKDKCHVSATWNLGERNLYSIIYSI